MTTRTTITALAALTLAATGLAGCSSDGSQGASKTSTASASAATKTPTSDPTKEAFAKAEAAASKWAVSLPAEGDVSGDFMTADYIKRTNADRKAIAQAGIHVTGTAKLISVTPVDYRTDPAPLTTVQVCSEGDPRLVDKNGKDVTYDTKGNPIPKGAKRSASLVQLTTPDDGGKWQVNSVQSDGRC